MSPEGRVHSGCAKGRGKGCFSPRKQHVQSSVSKRGWGVLKETRELWCGQVVKEANRKQVQYLACDRGGVHQSARQAHKSVLLYSVFRK